MAFINLFLMRLNKTAQYRLIALLINSTKKHISEEWGFKKTTRNLNQLNILESLFPVSHLETYYANRTAAIDQFYYATLSL